MTPERVVYAGRVDGEQRERDAEQVVHQKRVACTLRTARECVVQSR